MGGQGLNPLSLGGSENVGAETSQSSTTEEVTIGGTGPLTGAFGDKNEWIPLFNIGNYRFDRSWTNTSYGDPNEIHSGARRFAINTNTIPSITGIDTHGVGLWVSDLSNDTAGETSSVKLYDNANSVNYDDTEVEATNPDASNEVGGIQTFQHTGTINLGVNGKVTGGTGSVNFYKAIIYGRIA